MATLRVEKLKYQPVSGSLERAARSLDFLPTKMRPIVSKMYDGALVDVTFTAKPHEVTGIMGPNKPELDSLVGLLSSSRNYGTFDGEVYISGAAFDNRSSELVYIASDAFRLYIPGLTYYQTVKYYAMLKIRSEESVVLQQVDTILEFMGLSWCKNRVIPERPKVRGTLGGELRRLRIAAEIVDMPAIILLEDPFLGLDSSIAVDLMKRMRNLSDMGRTVICSFTKVDEELFDMIQSTVVVVNGRTVYNAPNKHILDYFCSRSVGYVKHEETSVSDFLLDIATGVERPQNQRTPYTAAELQDFFESSEYSESFKKSGDEILVMPRTRPKPYVDLLMRSTTMTKGYFFRRIRIAFERSWVTKFSEYAVLRKSVITALVPSTFIGYFVLGQGSNFGDYLMSMFNIPYPEVTNAASMLFICNAFVFVTQVLNVHIVCQKLRVFRYEQQSGLMSSMLFYMSTLMCELPFALLYSVVFSIIIYFMIDYGDTLDDFNFFMKVQGLTAMLGVFLTLVLAALFRREFVVRDLFLFFLFLMLIITGFPFSFRIMRQDMIDLAWYNPLRWSFESLMSWCWKDYPDGPAYLAFYKFENFDHNSIGDIFGNFFAFFAVLFLLSLAPGPNFLRRRTMGEQLSLCDPKDDLSRISVASDFEETATKSLVDGAPKSESATISSKVRNTESSKRAYVPPVLFMRETRAGASTVQLSTRPSATGLDGSLRGPVIHVKKLNIHIKDSRSPLGYKKVLNNVSAKFDWGKLCAIMGAKDSGKSSLLQVLCNTGRSSSMQITGTVQYNDAPLDRKAKSWQQCALIESVDEHFRDLTVEQIVRYAMQLRCITMEDTKVVESNVAKTLELLYLTEVKDVAAKSLSHWYLRRLTLAEEIVHGPQVVLADEPITNLPQRDCAIIMNSFREMVNQDRTVVMTMHEPSRDVFDLIDTLVVLSKGSAIYMGPAHKAVSFFIESPLLRIQESTYSNPADFLANLSAGNIKNTSGAVLDSIALSSNWKNSIACIELEASILPTAIESDAGSRTKDISVDRSESTKMSMDIGYRGDSFAKSKMAPRESEKFWQTSMFDLSFDNVDLTMTFYRMMIILKREFHSYVQRPAMIIASFVLQVFISCLYGILMKAEDASVDPGGVTSYFGFGAVLIMLSMLQLAFFLLNNVQVFLKEQARGLYSITSYWLVALYPLLFLRTLHFIIYCLISHEFMGLQGGDVQAFYYLNMFCFQIGSSLLSMFFIIQAKAIRDIYYSIPASAFLLFFFSGMLVKPSTLPRWCAPWMPSISIMRWFMQGGIINEAYGNTDLFPVIPVGNFDAYVAYMEIFGWNGKTKYDCIYVTAINIAIYYVICWVAMWLAANGQKGVRSLRTQGDDERLF